MRWSEARSLGYLQSPWPWTPSGQVGVVHVLLPQLAFIGCLLHAPCQARGWGDRLEEASGLVLQCPGQGTSNHPGIGSGCRDARGRLGTVLLGSPARSLSGGRRAMAHQLFVIACVPANYPKAHPPLMCDPWRTGLLSRTVGASQEKAVGKMGSRASRKIGPVAYLRKSSSLVSPKLWKNKAGSIETERIREQK